jgi:hypothetical protein
VSSHALQFQLRRPSLRLRFAAWREDRTRRSRADSLERAVEQAGRPSGLSAAVPVRAEALEVRDELLALAALLRTTPAPPRSALALCRELILDGTSPLFNPEAAGTLPGAVNEARHAFQGDRQTYPPEA